MINANELRIGNWVGVNGVNLQIERFCDTFILFTNKRESHYSGIEPVPLTPEILEKAGFVPVNWINGTSKFDYAFMENHHEWNFYPTETIYWHGHRINNIKHIHQLQNLYFALTGEELTIKL